MKNALLKKALLKKAMGRVAVLVVLAVLAAGCSGDEGGQADGGNDDSGSSDSGDGGSDDDSSGDDGAGGSNEGGDGDGDGEEPDNDGPDNDDAAEILGDPDLDLEELPDDIADTIDDIDDVVSIGECASELLGIGFEAPEDWMCRVLDQAVGGLDGFTLFTEGNELNLTVGTPSPIEPCEALQQCADAVPIALSDEWPGTMLLDVFGTVLIWGRHPVVDAELIITKFSELTDEEVAFISSVLDTTEVFG